MESKVCRTCKVDLPVTSFNRHPAGKFGVDSKCRECQKKYMSEYSLANSEKASAKAKEWYERNKERGRESRKLWRSMNRDKHQEHTRNRRITGRVHWANQAYIRIFYQLAKLESVRTGRKVEVDHIVPLNGKTVCGLHVEYNLQLLFSEDNKRKSNVVWPEMA